MEELALSSKRLPSDARSCPGHDRISPARSVLPDAGFRAGCYYVTHRFLSLATISCRGSETEQGVMAEILKRTRCVQFIGRNALGATVVS